MIASAASSSVLTDCALAVGAWLATATFNVVVLSAKSEGEDAVVPALIVKLETPPGVAAVVAIVSVPLRDVVAGAKVNAGPPEQFDSDATNAAEPEEKVPLAPVGKLKTLRQAEKVPDDPIPVPLFTVNE